MRFGHPPSRVGVFGCLSALRIEMPCRLAFIPVKGKLAICEQPAVDLRVYAQLD
jgi:hypothetical protein